MGPHRLRNGEDDSAAESDFSSPESSGSGEQEASEISRGDGEADSESGGVEAAEEVAEGVEPGSPQGVAIRAEADEEESSEEFETRPIAWMGGAEGQLAERTQGLEGLRSRLRRGVARYRRGRRLGLATGPVVGFGLGRFDRFRTSGLYGWALHSNYRHDGPRRVRPLRTEFYGRGGGRVEGWRVENGGPFRRRGILNLQGYAIRLERELQARRDAQSVRREAERQAVEGGRVGSAEAAGAGESGPSQPRSDPRT